MLKRIRDYFVRLFTKRGNKLISSISQDVVDKTIERAKKRTGPKYRIRLISENLDYKAEDWVTLIFAFHQLGFSILDVIKMMEDVFYTEEMLARYREHIPDMPELHRVIEGVHHLSVDDAQYVYLRELLGSAKGFEAAALQDRFREEDRKLNKQSSLANALIVLAVTIIVNFVVEYVKPMVFGNSNKKILESINQAATDLSQSIKGNYFDGEVRIKDGLVIQVQQENSAVTQDIGEEGASSVVANDD
ncbi:hypothetical protein KDL30_13455 [bacterium]|nr:hypothetical protein [bacterium]MCB1221664.1 hypothetical protein [bacterium]